MITAYQSSLRSAKQEFSALRRTRLRPPWTASPFTRARWTRRMNFGILMAAAGLKRLAARWKSAVLLQRAVKRLPQRARSDCALARNLLKMMGRVSSVEC